MVKDVLILNWILGDYMTYEQLKILIYEFLWFEEERLTDGLEIARRCMLQSKYNSYYVLKYYEASRQLEDFRIFQRKVCYLLRS